MFYQETCQLGFNEQQSPNQDLYFIAQQDHSENDNFLNKQHDQGSLKLNFEKRVSFGEQLGFNFNNKGMQMESESLQPIEFKKPAGQQNEKRSSSKKKKKAPNKKMGFFEGQIQAMLANKKKTLQSAEGVKKQPSAQKVMPQLPAFNLDTRPQGKYFDPSLDPKFGRVVEKTQKPQQKTGQALPQTVVEKDHNGKIEVGVRRLNGSGITSKFEMYNNIEAVEREIEAQKKQSADLSMKKKLFPMAVAGQKKLTQAVLSPQSKSPPRNAGSGKRSIQIAPSEVALHNEEMFKELAPSSQKKPSSSQKEQMAEDHFTIPQALEQSLLKQGTQVDMKLHHLVGQALQQKEAMIKVLEEQLAQERHRREALTSKFREQLSDFEQERDALDRLRKASNLLEKRQLDRHGSQASLSNVNHSQATAGGAADLDMVPTKESHRSSKQLSSQSKKKIAMSYRPDRVKSSIPKMMSQQSISRGAATIRIPTLENEQGEMEEMQRQEVERAFRLKREEEIAIETMQRLRFNHPNAHLNELQTEVAMLNRKVEPLLQRVEEAARNVKIANDNNGPLKKGPLGMLSKMGGRLISFYADDLAEMLLQDFLGETAQELQRMENQQLKDYTGEEAKICAEALLKNLVDYQSEEAFLSMKWNNPALKGGAGSKKFAKGPSQPAPVQFNLNDDLQPVVNASIDDSQSFSAKKSQTKYENPFNSQNIDPFSLRLTKNGPDESLRMQQPALVQFENEAHLLDSDLPKRKYKVVMETQTLHNITLYREKYEKFLKMHNNTANKDVWKAYDHIAADIFHELYSQALSNVQKDMEEYIEKVIVDEFQIGV